MQFSAYGIYLSGRSAAEHNFNYTCHPCHLPSFYASLIRVALAMLLNFAAQKPKFAFLSFKELPGP